MLINLSNLAAKRPVGLININTNLLLTEREVRTGEYWPEVVTVRTERSELRTKRTEGQYSPVRPEQARLVSSLLYGPYCKILTEKEPIRAQGFA